MLLPWRDSLATPPKPAGLVYFTVIHISEKRLNAAIEKVLSLCGSCWGLLCASAEIEMRSDLQNL